MLTIKRTLRGVLALGAAASFLASAATADITIGLSFASTGPYATISKASEVAFDLAIEEINAAGGVNGQMLKAVKFDTSADPKQAALAVRKLAKDDGALAIVGPFSSGEVRVAFPAGEREGIVQISNASTAPKMAHDFSYAFRYTIGEFPQMIRVIKTMKAAGELNKSVVVYGTDDFISKAVGLQIMTPLFEKFGVEVGSEPIGFSVAAFDLAPQVAQLKEMELDYIGFGGITPLAIRFVKELRRQGIDTPIIGPGVLGDPLIIPGMGNDCEGCVLATFFLADRNDAAKAFSEKFNAAAKEIGIDRPFPHQVDAAAYDAVFAIAQVMREQGITGAEETRAEERTKIRNGLQTAKFSGIIGDTCFNKSGDAQLPGYVVRLENGGWTLLGEHAGASCE
jgi:branched-chain amino acid transport system substrate-binding protein